MEDAYNKSTREILNHFQVTEEQGLTNHQVESLKQIHGSNSLPEDPPTPLIELILEQFKDQLVLILLGSAALSFVLALFEGANDITAFVDPIVILTILILNAVVGVSQESNAEKAIAALQEYSANEAKVIRNGHTTRIKADELVPGDIITVSVGDRIPADSRLLSIQSNSFSVDQSILTGESESVEKFTQEIKEKDLVKQDQVNILFSGTTVTNGHSNAIVCLTGTKTAIGDIHESITNQISQPTPLKEKLNDFGDVLAKVITIICALVWLINIRHFSDSSHGGWLKGAIYYLKIAVSLGVAAIPEGLAVVITTCLALGTRKMAQKNAIVRSLPSVETLGSCNVICSDKTGTLTTNQMSCNKLLFIDSDSNQKEVNIQGTSFEPNGSIEYDNEILSAPCVDLPILQKFSECSSFCNDSLLSYDSKTQSYNIIGEPTEGALRVLVEKLGTIDQKYNLSRRSLNDEDKIHYNSSFHEAKSKTLKTLEFSRDRKSMSVLIEDNKSKSQKLLVKGAPESILNRCTSIFIGENGKKVSLSKDIIAKLQNKIEEYGNNGWRVIALAEIDDVDVTSLNKSKTTKDYELIEQKMTFIGLTSMLDPPRKEVRQSIENCLKAGIKVIVITGDNKNTAEAICKEIGLFSKDENLSGKSFTGKEFDLLSEKDQLHAVQKASLFSRTEPTHKSRLVDLLQSAGFVVAMTGDGVNDAPALKMADIGISMGSGTDVARLASDMVLIDDNFSTIENAIKEGRCIYNNTQQFIRYLISSNIGEVVSIFLTAAIGMPEALIPVQLLWVNLVTDGLPATALSFNPPDHDVMRRLPRRRDEPLVSGWLFFRYMVIGTYVGIATVGGYAWYFLYNSQGPQISFQQLSSFHRCAIDFPEIGCQIFSDHNSKIASTISLSILVVIEMFNAVNALSSSESLLTLPLWKNMMLVWAISLSMFLHFAILYVPFLQQLFSISSLNWNEWKAVLYISAPIIVIDEVLKYFERLLFLPKSIPNSSEKHLKEE